MRILLDVDGVVADFLSPVIALGLRWADGSAVTRASIRRWAFFDDLDGESEARLLAALRQDAFWRELPVVEGAPTVVAALRSLGHEALWVTSPWRGCPSWLDARCAWLARHFGAAPSEVLCLDRKELVDGDAFVDDRAETVAAWQAAHPCGVGLVVPMTYNEGLYPSLPRWSVGEPLLGG